MDKGSNSTKRILIVFLSLVFFATIIPSLADAVSEPVQISSSPSDFTFSKPIRTSTGRLYLLHSNADGNYSGGWLDVFSSNDGINWAKVSSHGQSMPRSVFSAAIDSQDIIHVLAYNLNGQPYYEKFHTQDSLQGNNSWEGYELISNVQAGGSGISSLAVDANDVPHITYLLRENYKGNSYLTVYYANRINGVWNKKVIIPKTAKSFLIASGIVIGPDNCPYFRIGSKILKGDGNNPGIFEEKDFGVSNLSFVIHNNGDVRASMPLNSTYANYVHDHTQAWTSGWTLYSSGKYYYFGDLILINDVPYKVIQDYGNGILLQKEFDDPIQIVTVPYSYKYFNGNRPRWSFYNHHFPEIIDIGLSLPKTATINVYAFSETNLRTLAFFTAYPRIGAAPLTVYFSDESVPGMGESILYWAWDFNGDNIADSFDQNPAVTFTEPGQYTTSLTVTDSGGNTDTAVRPDYILVDGDNDNDGFVNSKDNCPSAYNANQADLDSDSIGDACDTYNDLLGQALYLTGLKTETALESAISDATLAMKDGVLTQASSIQKSKRSYNALSFKSNADSSELASLQLDVYVSRLYNGVPQPARIYAYASDGIAIQPTAFIDRTLSLGWNTLDLTPILHTMDGFGFVKVRLVSQNLVDIAEAELTGTSNRGVDDLRISVNPSSIDFGSLNVGDYNWSSFTVSNTGTGTLKVETIPSPPLPFRIYDDDCSGKSLNSSESCTVMVEFIPETEGSYFEQLSIPTNDMDNPNTAVSLTGSTPQGASIAGVVTDFDTGLPLGDVSVTVKQPRNLNLRQEYFNYTRGCLDSSSMNSDADMPVRYSAIDYDSVMYNDENKSMSTYCGIDKQPVGLFKMRNPLNNNDSFKVAWNGLASDYSQELLGQSFIPAKTGKLTKISLNLKRDLYFGTWGTVKVFLKSKLGGESDAILAESDKFPIVNIPTDSLSWIDFTFSNPATLTAGETYYLELHGNGCHNYSLFYCALIKIFWGYQDPDPYSSGKGFVRYDSKWNTVYPGASNNWSFSFKSFIDNQPDQQQTQSCCDNIYMYPINNFPVYSMGIYNRVTELWESLTSKIHVLGYDDDTLEKHIENSNKYYDINGWVSLRIIANDDYSYLVTDQFKLEFEKTVSAINNSSGWYTLSNIAPGSFTVQFKKVGYEPQTIDDLLISGQTQTINVQLKKAPPLLVAITSPADGAVVTHSPIAVYVTATNNAEVTINGIPGDYGYIEIFVNEGQNTITAVATDQYGQTASHSITVTRGSYTPPQISNISSDNITTDSATISWTTDQLSDSVVEYGETTAYGNIVSDAEFVTSHSITLNNLNPDTNYHFKVSSKNVIGISSSSEDQTFTTLKFMATTIGDYGNVTVMEVAGNYNSKNPDDTINYFPRQEIAKEFYKNHQDQYDFFVIFTNFDFTLPEAGAKAYYLEVKNDIQGIGKQILDESSQYGSNSKLQGIIEMGNFLTLASNPSDPNFEGVIETLAHEQMHRWGASVKFKDSNNIISSALIGKDGEHWSYLLDTDGSLIYGNDWKDNGDGTFTSVSASKYYSPLDLYLMGLYDKTQVPQMLLIDNPNVDKTKLPEIGATISGTAAHVTIDDIISAEGERTPDASSSQKLFKTAFIFITRPGTFTGNETAGIENIRNAWAGRFASLTNGKGTIAEVTPSINIAISSPSNGETISRPYTMVKGAFINNTGKETGITVNGMPATVYGNQFVVNSLPLIDGANTITVTATDTAGNTTTSSINVNTVTTGNYIRLVSNIESGISPLEVVLRIDGSFSIASSNLHISGPTQPEVISSTPEEYRLKFIAEGIYYVTTSSTGPDDVVHEDTITVIVLNKTQLDALLKGKWEGMEEALLSGDIEESLSYFVEGSIDRYRQVFTDVGSVRINSILSSVTELRFSSTYGPVAQYWALRTESDGTFAYPITFFQNANGIWKIMGF